MLIIQIPFSNSNKFLDLANSYPSEIKLVKRKNYHGEPDTMQFLINITPLLITFITKIVVEYLRNKKDIVFIYKGAEFRNMNHKKIVELLELIFQDKDLNPSEFTLNKKNEN